MPAPVTRRPPPGGPRRGGQPGQRGPGRHVQRAHRAGVAKLQGRGRRAVVLPPGEPGRQPHPVLMRHGGVRLVADPPAGRGQPPDEVDVLPDPHVLGEARPGRVLPHDQRRARDVGDARPRAGRCWPARPCPGWNSPPRTAPARSAHAPPGRSAARPRRPPDPRSAAAGRSSQPGPGTQSESRNATSGVSAAARPVFLAAAGPPLTGRRSTSGARPGCDPRDRGRIGRGVINHDHAGHPGQAGQAAGQFGLPVVDRDHHRHVIRNPRTRRASRADGGLRDPGVEQAAGQRAGPGVVRDGRT